MELLEQGVETVVTLVPAFLGETAGEDRSEDGLEDRLGAVPACENSIAKGVSTTLQSRGGREEDWEKSKDFLSFVSSFGQSTRSCSYHSWLSKLRAGEGKCQVSHTTTMADVGSCTHSTGSHPSASNLACNLCEQEESARKETEDMDGRTPPSSPQISDS